MRAAVDEAFRWDAVQRKLIAQVQSIRRRLKQLAPPLRDVLELLLKGKSNREIADELGLSVRSIEVRRAKVMRHDEGPHAGGPGATGAAGPWRGTVAVIAAR